MDLNYNLSSFLIIVQEGRLSCVGQHSLPGSVLLPHAVGLPQACDGDHCDVLVDVAHRKRSETGHRSVDCARGQMCAEFAVVAVGWDCSDHVGGVDVFESSWNSLRFAEFDYFVFEENADILDRRLHTGGLMLPEPSRSTPFPSFSKSLTPSPAPSATTITRWRLIFSCYTIYSKTPN